MIPVSFKTERLELSENEIERIAAAVAEKVGARLATELKTRFPRDFRGVLGA